MKPIKFKGCNRTYAKDQPEYLNLPVHKTPGGDVTSCWKLTWKERLQVFFTGRIYFSVWTFNKPLQPQRPMTQFKVNQ